MPTRDQMIILMTLSYGHSSKKAKNFPNIILINSEKEDILQEIYDLRQQHQENDGISPGVSFKVNEFKGIEFKIQNYIINLIIIYHFQFYNHYILFYLLVYFSFSSCRI